MLTTTTTTRNRTHNAPEKKEPTSAHRPTDEENTDPNVAHNEPTCERSKVHTARYTPPPPTAIVESSRRSSESRHGKSRPRYPQKIKDHASRRRARTHEGIRRDERESRPTRSVLECGVGGGVRGRFLRTELWGFVFRLRFGAGSRNGNILSVGTDHRIYSGRIGKEAPLFVAYTYIYIYIPDQKKIAYSNCTNFVQQIYFLRDSTVKYTLLTCKITVQLIN